VCAVHPPWNAFGEDPADAVEPYGSIHDVEGDRRRPGGARLTLNVVVEVQTRDRARIIAHIEVESRGGGSGAESPFRKAGVLFGAYRVPNGLLAVRTVFPDEFVRVNGTVAEA